MAAQIRGQRFRDYRLPDRHSGAEAEGKARGREPGNLFFHKLLIAFYRRRSPQQNFTGRGEKKLLSVVLEQLYVVQLFQIVYMLRNCRLGNMKRLGGLGIIHIFAYG